MTEPVGMLNDLSRCIGCRGCQVACKAWNRLPAVPTRNHGSNENPIRLSDHTWTRIHFSEGREDGSVAWFFAKRQCLHCLEPACVAACPVGAMQKTQEGPVIYHRDRCIGCRYCMVACPWSLPRFDWQDSVPYIHKCTMCFDRLQAGDRPACANTCPTGAISFGPRTELLAEARRRLARWPGRYVPHIYGEKEVGGTSVLYLSPAPFEQVGWPAMDSTPVNRYTAEIMSKVPFAFLGVAAAMGGIYWFSKRREELARGEKPDGEGHEREDG